MSGILLVLAQFSLRFQDDLRCQYVHQNQCICFRNGVSSKNLSRCPRFHFALRCPNYHNFHQIGFEKIRKKFAKEVSKFAVNLELIETEVVADEVDGAAGLADAGLKHSFVDVVAVHPLAAEFRQQRRVDVDHAVLVLARHAVEAHVA